MQPLENDPLIIKARTHAELDALVGKHLTGETPHVYWEDSRTHLHFETLDEAREALQDPFFSRLDPAGGSTPVVFTQISEYRRYSSELDAAWDVVENISLVSGRALTIRWERPHWVATFDTGIVAHAPTAPLAICLAALRFHGIDVALALPDQPA